MRIKEILLEYNLQNLLSLFSEKYKQVQQKDHSNEYESLEEFIKSIEEPLRKENKFQFIEPYMKWIVQRYVTNNLGLYEDVISKVIPGLLTYDSLKRKNKLKPIHKDINQVKNIHQLLDILDEYQNEDTKSISEKEKEIEQNFYKNNEAELIYNDPDIKIVVPKTERASCYFGRNTRWCTAATNSRNYFKAYNRKGRLYIILDKKNNRKFQFHFNTFQFMDEKDSPINIVEFKKKYPKVIDLFSNMNVNKKLKNVFKPVENLTSDDIIKLLKSNEVFIKNYGLNILPERKDLINKRFLVKFYNFLTKEKNMQPDSSVKLLKDFFFLVFTDQLKMDKDTLKTFIKLFSANLYMSYNDFSYFVKNNQDLFNLKEIKKEIRKKSIRAYIFIYGFMMDVLTEKDIQEIYKENQFIELMDVIRLDYNTHYIYFSKRKDLYKELLKIFNNSLDILKKYYLIALDMYEFIYKNKKEETEKDEKLQNLIIETLLLLNDSKIESFDEISGYDFMKNELFLKKIIKKTKNIFLLKNLNVITKDMFFECFEEFLKNENNGSLDEYKLEKIIDIFSNISSKTTPSVREKLYFVDNIIRISQDNFKNAIMKKIIFKNKVQKTFEDLFKSNIFKDYFQNILMKNHKKFFDESVISYFENYLN
ncbi:MAG: hypothetical protein NZZ41_05470 [Candidatus Dojkabacteria bacterium]|nr:hypothetical protein [Candidatus Dojkabacteria bacterium]